MGTHYDKRDVLQVLLDTGNMAGELFDAVEADSFVITPSLLNRLATLNNRFTVLHRQMVLDYALSGRAGDDMLASIQDQLREERRAALVASQVTEATAPSREAQ